MVVAEFTANAFDSFNARAASPAQVARTFIPPKHYQVLARRAHTLVVGPRGSGKTTLLKMLTPEALQCWRGEDAERARKTVDFTGVFVPTDIMWSKQLEAMTLGAAFEQDEANLFINASFTVAVFRAFVTALITRVHPMAPPGGDASFQALTISPGDEAALVDELADAWRVPVRVRSLAGLRAGLGSMLSMVGELASAERFRPVTGRAERLANETIFHRDMIAGVGEALDRLAIFAPSAREERWALMFDELELAPVPVRERLLASLRSVDQRLLFKLCISPYSSELSQLQDAMSAMPDNDHNEISLSYGRKEEAGDFTYDLMAAVLRARKWPTTDPREMFGRSDFESDGDRAGDREEADRKYHPGSRFMRFVRDLEKEDASFRAYLESHGASPSRLLELSGNERAQVLRKVMPLVIVRAAYRSSDAVFGSTGRRYKSRKSPDIYRGFETLSAMLEGNPRWIISLMTSLTDETSSRPIVPVSSQMREISRTANRFRALLATVPSEWEGERRRRGLLPMIDDVGRFFRERVIADPFNADPPSTFTVDSTVPDSLLQSIGSAVNVGALVFIPDPGGAAILSSLRGKRFRLTYLFAPNYGLPPRLQREVSLVSVLGDSRKHGGVTGQESLPMGDI